MKFDVGEGYAVFFVKPSPCIVNPRKSCQILVKIQCHRCRGAR